MTTRLVFGTAGLVLAATVAALPIHHAQAAAFQLRENSTVNLGTAFAGAGSAADTPATTFDNPAGLTQLPGTQVYGGGSLIAPSFTFHGTATNAFGQPISGASDRDGGNPAFVPYGYVTDQVSDAISVGLALTSPFGLATYYGPNFVGRYQADKTELTTIDINPNIAWKVTDWLSLGAGFSANDATAEFASAINSPAVGFAALGRVLPLPDGLFRLRSENDWAFGYNFGALITVDPSTRIGLTYRSRIQHDFSGTADIAVPFPLSLSPALGSGPASAKLVLPDTAAISVTHVFSPQWTGYADLRWTDWSVFRSLNVYRTTGQPISLTPEHYRNTGFVSLGASYAVSDAVTLRGGLGFDATPTTNRYRTARVPDSDRFLVAGGASWRFTSSTTLDAAYSHVFVADSRIDETSATGDVLAGHYSNSIDIVSLGLRAGF